MSTTTTGIQWTDRTWNVIRGCSIVSPGCRSCYAMKQAHRFSGTVRRDGKGAHEAVPGPYHGLTKQTKAGPQWTGVVRTVESALLEPLSWRKPARIFVNSMSDLFHEGVPDAFIDRVFAVMALCPQHTFQILTKRPERMLRYCTSIGRDDGEFEPDLDGEAMRDAMIEGTAQAIYARLHPREDPSHWLAVHQPLPNVWLGVSCENQDTLHRIDTLKDTPASIRFVSFEPLLEDLGALMLDRIDWAIIGLESGPGARPGDLAWVRSIVRQCRVQGVAPFVKQLGAKPRGICSWPHHDESPPIWLDRDGCIRAVSDRPASDFDLCHAVDDAWWPCAPRLKSRKGGDPSEWPGDLRIREWPREVAV